MGSLARWDDERGFGFIQPNEGGPQVFVHVTAFGDRRARPAVGEVLVFDIVTGTDGRRQARRVQYVDRAAPTGPHPGRRSTPSGRPQVLPLVPVVGVAGHMAVAVLLLGVAWWVPAVYLGMSTLAFALNASDKRRARTGRWRISEATLQLAGLACGWPGAVLAQQVLRHKNRKPGFQGLFWVLVALNWLTLAALIHAGLLA